MPSPKRVILAVAIGISAGLIILVAEQVVRNYPAPDGISMADGQVLGGDFVAFYVGGRLFDMDRARVYDFDRQRELRVELLGPAGSSPEAELPFFYPPLMAALASSFSRFRFQHAFFLWTALGLTVSISSLLLVMRGSGATKVVPLPLLLLFCFGFVPFSMNTVLGGQASWLGVGVLAGVSLAILHQRDFTAGAAMSLSYYKPPLFLLLLVVLCLARGRKFILGFASGAIILIGATFLSVGPAGILKFLDAASSYAYREEVVRGLGPPMEGMGLAALSASVFDSLPASFLALLVFASVLGWVGFRLLRTRSEPQILLGLMLSISASLALSVYVLKYDLALLLIPMVLGIAWYGREESVRRGLVLLPFLGFFFEFPLRQLSIGGEALNASSFFFLVLLGVLGWQGWRSSGTSAPTAFSQSSGPCPP